MIPLLRTGSASLRILETADFDGDGLPDIFSLVSLAPGYVAPLTYLNQGNGLFDARLSPTQILGATGSKFDIGDVDADGDLDVVGLFGSAPILWLGDGSGHFDPTRSASLPVIQNAVDVAMGDLDGDGILDLVFACQSSPYEGRQNRLFFGRSTLSFTNATSRLPQRADISFDVELIDVDLDGDLDIYFANAGRDRVCLNVSGSFVDATVATPMRHDNSYSLAPIDGDGDGDLDLFVTNDAGLLYLENAAGTFIDQAGAIPALPIERHGLSLVEVGDVDGDGDLDGVLTPSTLQGQTVRPMLVNDGSGRFSLRTIPVHPDMEFPQPFALLDVDQDRDLDLVIQSTAGPRMALNDGAGTFAETRWPTLPSFDLSTTDLVLADFDGDTDLDAYCIGNSAGRAYRNDGRGGFSSFAGSQRTDPDLTSVDAADVDGDGHLDLLLGRKRSPAEEILLGDGRGGFQSSSSLPPASDWTAKVLLADISGDGLPDLLSSRISGLRYHRNLGGGAFADESFLLPQAFVVGTFAVADLDGDLDLDILAADDFDGRILVIRNVGSRGFTVERNLPRASFLTYGIRIGDLDGDGDQDAIVWKSGATEILWNDGTGVFTPDDMAIPRRVSNVVLADIDLDLDLDVIAGGRGHQIYQGWAGIALYRNDGAGHFTLELEAAPVVLDTRCMEVGDLDQDGDPDLWIGQPITDRILWNRDQQLMERALPRIGKPWDLDLYGSPSAPWLLMASALPGRVPLGPYGVGGLDPANIHVIGSGMTDARGRGVFGTTIPRLPAMIGVRAYAQALIGAGTPPTTPLTNTWEVRMTGL
ncbi:MAG: VCBS repeat-containing protein [Planctomycetes bacterium]|nr:VCBS repeat-containing protein [Planctomycetota bacterium]